MTGDLETDTVAAALNSKPAGAFSMIVLPTNHSLEVASVIVGPVSVVYAPVPPADVVSIEIFVPPVAAVIGPDVADAYILTPRAAEMTIAPIAKRVDNLLKKFFIKTRCL
jgi:hypothetical protein